MEWKQIIAGTNPYVTVKARLYFIHADDGDCASSCSCSGDFYATTQLTGTQNVADIVVNEIASVTWEPIDSNSTVSYSVNIHFQ